MERTGIVENTKNLVPSKVSGPQSEKQLSDTETYSKNILGPVYFELSNLRVFGKAGLPEDKIVAPAQSPYIVASNEEFCVSVDITFNESPLTALLMCLGTRMTVDFAFEGLGGRAPERDWAVTDITVKDDFSYTLTFKSTPDDAQLLPGLYAIAGVVAIGPVENKCTTPILGYGYIAKQLLQVYPA
ncbi:hypothetical protein C7293_02860 [filamentous cyanobacterium CCT1]|nr:hypothetical protein C7293_02860 [filamentous cyanobacterium CCT1]PSN80120.1 hypothetical protein C8B47_08090 [filamentous cyanobacterium CCP4]